MGDVICVGKLYVKKSFVGVLGAERRILLKQNIKSYATEGEDWFL